MKTALPPQSKEHQAVVESIRDIILDTAKDKIAMIILFGSFARGDWVHDYYTEDGRNYEYASDYDFLVLTSSSKQGIGYPAVRLGNKISTQLKQFQRPFKSHNPSIVIEPIWRINEELEKGQYFFSDIKKEGVLLYDSGECKLAEARQLNEAELKEIAQADFEQWLPNGNNFLSGSKSELKEKRLKNSAFKLHQATECLLNCTLLVLTGYKPKTHDIENLLGLCASRSNDFLRVFPMSTEEQQLCFELLKRAYIEARYSKDYTISHTQLEYLIERVSRLKKLVESTCQKRLA